jgi:hypothetical protein
VHLCAEKGTRCGVTPLEYLPSPTNTQRDFEALRLHSEWCSATCRQTAQPNDTIVESSLTRRDEQQQRYTDGRTEYLSALLCCACDVLTDWMHSE